MKLELERPPINEVVCGFIFEQPIQLSPVLTGAYWASRRADFVEHEIKDPIVDEVGAVLLPMPPPVRTWLVTNDKTRLVQIQNDRFFVNWRRQSDTDAYPRFQSKKDQEPLLPFALREWARFVDFCASETSRPLVSALELSKIDVLIEGRDWNGISDLSKLMPDLASILGTESERNDVVWRYARSVDKNTRLFVTAASALHRSSGKSAIRLETRVRMAVTQEADLPNVFVDLDNLLNSIFVRMIGSEELKRFGMRNV